MDCIVHGVAKSQTRLGNFHFPLVHGDKFFDSGIEDVPSSCIPALVCKVSPFFPIWEVVFRGQNLGAENYILFLD